MSVSASNSTFVFDDFRNPKNVSGPCPRNCSANSFLYFSIFDENKKQWQESGDFLPESLEQIHEPQKFSPVSSLSNANISSTRRLDSQVRPQPGLLSSTHIMYFVFLFSLCAIKSFLFTYLLKRGTQTFSANHLQQSTTADDMFTIWPGRSTKDVCVNNKLDSRDTPCKRKPCSGLLRRLSNNKSMQGHSQLASSYCSGFLNQLRLVCQPGEIGHQTNKVDRISWYQLGHGTQHSLFHP